MCRRFGWGHADLTIDVPQGVSLTVTAERGDVRVSGLHAPVTVNANRGNVDLSGLTGTRLRICTTTTPAFPRTA